MRAGQIKLTLFAIVMLLASLSQFAPAQQFRGRRGEAEAGVYKARVNAHWFDDGKRFWYRNDLRDKKREFVLVDAEAGTRRPAFDHQRLAAALSKAAGGKEHAPD